MIKKISKRLFLIASVLVSGVLGFMYNGGDKDTTSVSVLKEPIFSIDTAYADGAGGDCSCSGSGDYTPPPESSYVYIQLIKE